MKALYNFEFDIAAEAFRDAQQADPAFALAYWGEAMSYNHPLWAEQNLPAARKALERFAPTAAERASKAPAGKERDLIEAADVLFGGNFYRESAPAWKVIFSTALIGDLSL